MDLMGQVWTSAWCSLPASITIVTQSSGILNMEPLRGRPDLDTIPG